MATKPRDRHQPIINLALQGGGAHGAYTWGVLDALLEEPKLRLEGVSGTSAGAVNAILLADGLVAGGHVEAQKRLRSFWETLSQAGAFFPSSGMPIDTMNSAHNLVKNPGMMALDWMTSFFSPYQLNPFNINPLRDILNNLVDFEGVQRHSQLKLFINATNVRTGKIKVFENAEITLDALMASTCLPLLFKAVEIDGESYWDGGYSGNPAIYPLIYSCDSPDVVIVQINPLCVDTVPTSAQDIMDRVNEISFNSTLMREMRAIAFVSKLIEDGKVHDDEYKDMRMHRIASEAEMQKFDASSKLVADPAMLKRLHRVGHDAATEWLRECWPSVGKRGTMDVRGLFL